MSKVVDQGGDVILGDELQQSDDGVQSLDEQEGHMGQSGEPMSAVVEGQPETESQKPIRKRRASSNFALEKKQENPKGTITEGQFWSQVRDGFVSPEEAIDHISKVKLIGTFRAIRVASAEFESKLTTPEPVLTVKKVKKQKAGSSGHEGI